MKWIIVVVMTTMSSDGFDAVEIHTRNNNPLNFETKRECEFHVKENYLALAIFAVEHFDKNQEVDDIYCVPSNRQINVYK
tara:strand:- start:361 stop:600 length:240 start_codon:yes stop_codon:yes gene_type:complete